MTTEIEKNIKELAESMGTNPIDLKCMAQGVVNAIKDWDLKDQVLNSNDEESKINIVEAGIVKHNEKFEKFVTAYLTQPEGVKKFNNHILADIVINS